MHALTIWLLYQYSEVFFRTNQYFFHLMPRNPFPSFFLKSQPWWSTGPRSFTETLLLLIVALSVLKQNLFRHWFYTSMLHSCTGFANCDSLPTSSLLLTLVPEGHLKVNAHIDRERGYINIYIIYHQNNHSTYSCFLYLKTYWYSEGKKYLIPC